MDRPTDWGDLVQSRDDRNFFQATERRAARDRHPQRVTRVGRKAPKPRDWPTGSRSAPLPLHTFVHDDGESRHDVAPRKPLAFTAHDYPIGAAVGMPRAGARIDDEHKLPAGGFTS